MKIIKQHWGYLIAGLFGVLCLQAGEPVSPDTIAVFGPVPVLKPVMLDSVNLDGTPYSDRKSVV